MELSERLIRILLSSFLFLNSLVMCQGQYECGQHGRFEYCIDGIPGCVVGCHCHPGYYFDTDTKICEPNVKLTKDYRRHYSLEPTRLPLSSFSVKAEQNEPSPTTTDVISKNADAITNDVDDLGDWLYNQFFKTIENQVINNTEAEPNTRKSGTNGFVKARKPKRNSRKKHSKKKFPKKGLRRKLLRITEDDSLFDSESGSNSGSATSDHSSSSSTDSHSDSSGEDERKKGHDQRKIIMYSKKPTPPLPSFIFLPNIETPFYPPIGLPPPPVVPMFPMVPVPPVFPSTKCNGVGSSNTSTTEPSKSTEQTTNKTIVTEPELRPTELPPPEVNPGNKEQMLRHRNLRRGDKQNQRSRLLHKLREKMKKKYKTSPRKHFDGSFDILDSIQDDDSVLQELLKYHSESVPRTVEPEVEDVNFKYLSQLIHKPNRNKMKYIANPSLPNGGIDSNFRRIANILDTSVKGNINTLPKLDEGDNSYYTKLGREIASLIRRVDSKGEIHTDVQQRQSKTGTNPVFNENIFSPRSFWERSVRSALNDDDYSIYTKNLDYILDSSEKLISLEEHVNFAASTKPTLTLQQLENMVHFIDRTRKNQLEDKLKKVSAKRLHINLLPPEANNQLNVIIPRRMQKPTNEVTNINRHSSITNRQSTHPANTLSKLNKIEYRININKTLNMNIDDRSIPTKDIKQNPNKPPLLNFWNKVSNLISPLHQQVSRLISNKNTPNLKITKQPLNPVADKYNNWNYDNFHYKYFEKPVFHKNYHLEQENPYQVGVFTQRRKPASYFHHEMRHFDYFD